MRRGRAQRGAMVVLAALTVVAGLLVAIPGLTARPARAATVQAASGNPGYWLMAADGGVYGFGAPNYGSLRGVPLNQPVVGGADTPAGRGYWMVARDGGIFTFGDARFFGSTGGIRLNQPVVGMASTPDGGGYWLVARDGGIFTFGDARFFGSTGGIRLNQPVVGMASTFTGGGYWLVARDGGIFTFGDARFFGSTGGIRLNRPIVGMAATANSGGYWLAATDGGLFTFGNAPFEGSTGGAPGPSPIVAIVATPDGGLYPPGAQGYDISKWQCGNLPPPAAVAIVQVSGGYIEDTPTTPPNPCFTAEAAWAGSGLSIYIFMGNNAPAEGINPYTYGWDWAQHWVAVARGDGVSATTWWLDVEGFPCQTAGVVWQCGAAGQDSNHWVVQGAIDALHADGLVVGIYSTYLQWPAIVGSYQVPGIPIWIAWAPADSSQANLAYWSSLCTNPSYAFAGGVPAVVQWIAGVYNSSPYDQDYAC